jgi:hypothetical protein
MKKLGFLAGLMIICLLFSSSCDLIDELSDANINPDETVAKEGNMWSADVAGYTGLKATISQNDKGIAKVQVSYDGKDFFLTSRVSKTKIEDFVYSNGDDTKGFTLCDFDAGVGTKWEYTVGTQKVVREVTHKSTDDDTYAPGLGLMVKVSEVTETIPDGLSVMGYPAQVKQIKWSFNHKFGFIRAEVQKNDLSWVTVNMSGTNVGSGK